jgi:hypothetical protein
VPEDVGDLARGQPGVVKAGACRRPLARCAHAEPALRAGRAAGAGPSARRSAGGGPSETEVCP